MDASMAEETHPGPAVAISNWTQLSEMRDPDDNWTGVTDTTERKKRQNRLNQRAVRRRRRLQQDNSTWTTQAQGGVSGRLAEGMESRLVGQTQPQAYGGYPQHAGHLLQCCPQRSARYQSFMKRAYEDYSLNAPRPAFLQVLIRINVLNAMARNAMMLGLPVEGLCHDDFISPFSYHGPHLADSRNPLITLPKSLQPTAMQMTITHHPWIDTFPIPRLRDNVLQGIVTETLDEDELCKDLLRVEDEKAADDKPCLIIWGDPWDISGWEASVAFLKKWGWLLDGCPELLTSTNNWRALRGEKMLNFGDPRRPG
ncbi:hypothetical protein EDB81DRAFT_898455 [Dactylonectria macrodidyma]|uniref:BZIP domain-containing protein n=1 Tax=Dactylonectria macrodidyma TaxID=307937 RepID=A0A9P9FVD0_9HYPO|nr:hypothetical protein EDB81DRAFT_898455 [Dactylonectria macrodidyma]